MIGNKYTGLRSIGIYKDELTVYRIVAACFKPFRGKNLIKNLQHWHEVATFATKFIPQMNFFGVLPPLRMLRLDPWNLKQVMLAKG